MASLEAQSLEKRNMHNVFTTKNFASATKSVKEYKDWLTSHPIKNVLGEEVIELVYFPPMEEQIHSMQ